MSTTVTFQANFPAGGPSPSRSYTESGLIFTNSVGNLWCSPFVNRFVGTYGSPSKLIVTPNGGQTFTFISLQVCNTNLSVPAQLITFTGTKSDGQTVSQSFHTPSSSTAPQTFAPAGFVELVSLVVSLGYVAFDNLVFDAEATQTVTFQHGFPTGCPSSPAVYTEAGLSFSNSSGNLWCSPFANNFVGTYTAPSQLTVTPQSGGLFEFRSLQVCNANSEIPSQTITFVGIRADESQVVATFTTPDYNTSPQIFIPAGFANIKKLLVQLGPVAFDNLVFTM